MTNKHKQFKYRLRATLIKVLFSLLARLSLRNNHRVGALLGWMSILFPNRNRRITQVNIKRCFTDQSKQQQQTLIHNSLIETGKTATEVVPMWLWDKKNVLDTIAEVQNEELLREAYDAKQGVILAIPHLGNWEIIGLYCSSRYPMTSLYQPPKLMQFDNLVRHGRERLGAKLVATDNTGVKALLTALKQGELIGVLPDQEPKFGNGIFAPFFNIPAYSGTLVSRLIAKTNAKVIFGYAERLPKGEGYRLIFSSAPESIYADDLQTSVTGLNEGIENCIKNLPEQYQWSYYRFRTRQEGEERFYL